MALPTLSSPKFEIKLPSSGKTVQYRPYLVKEEKILLMAMESKDSKQILTAVQDVIDACTFGKVNSSEIPLFDLEFLFLKLRAKSVGEVAKLILKCEIDGHENEVSVNLDEVKVVKPAEVNNVIPLTDKVGVTLRYPSVKDVSSIEGDIQSSDSLISLIASSIESIYDETAVHLAKDSTHEEMKSFVESLNRTQFQKIEKFFMSMPRLEHTIKYTCSKCGHENSVTLVGLQSFFE